MRNPSTTGAQHTFSQVPPMPHPRSVFNRSCGLKTGFSSGDLIPVFLDETLPGDTFTMKPTLFIRLATLQKPIMDNIHLDVHYFFVPKRLLWNNFQKFMGEIEPDDTTDYVIPTCDAPSGGYLEDSLHDFMGIPPGQELTHNNLPVRAYSLIFNTWYRDQNLVDSVTVDLDDGPDDPADYGILKRGKRHDYFTSALPWPLKGGISVEIPLGSTAPLSLTGVLDADPTGTPPTFTGTGSGVTRLEGESGTVSALWSNDGSFDTTPENADWDDPQLTVDLSAGGGTADLSAALAADVNDMREAVASQQLLEREARSGTRYIELVKGAFGVSSSDARLQRPEFLGGGTTPIQINTVAQTSPAIVAGVAPLAQLGAFGTGVQRNRGFSKTFEEHGYVLGIASVRADLTYQQGLDRLWSRSTKFDFPWPEFMNLGEQEILSKEIYADGSVNDDDVFGYQERYGEYRYKPSQVTGVMRSSHTQSLDVWNLAQEFSTRPVLGETFIEEAPPIDRVIDVGEEVEFLLDAFFSYRCARPLPVYATPGLMRF